MTSKKGHIEFDLMNYQYDLLKWTLFMFIIKNEIQKDHRYYVNSYNYVHPYVNAFFRVVNVKAPGHMNYSVVTKFDNPLRHEIRIHDKIFNVPF